MFLKNLNLNYSFCAPLTLEIIDGPSKCKYRVVKKKREPKLFYKSSQNICPIKMKICMHNLNTYSFQNIKHEILNPKTFLDI